MRGISSPRPRCRVRASSADRIHQLWITPHGALKAAIRNKATVRAQQGPGPTAFAFTEPGRFTATVYVNAASLVERVESRAPDPVLGDTPMITTYSDYRDFGGVKFPTRIRQTQGGFPVLDLTVREVQPNAPADIQVPDLVRSAAERVTADKVADGVWFIGGGSHNSVAIEMKDHLVLVEAPLSEGRTGPVIDEVKQARARQADPLRDQLAQHFDHSGGLAHGGRRRRDHRHAGAEQGVLREARSPCPNAISPDRLAKSGKKAQFRGVDEQAHADRRHAHGSSSITSPTAITPTAS